LQKKFFRNSKGQIVDVVKFCEEHAGKNKSVYVGTDSVTQQSQTMFVTVVAIRNGNSGATYRHLKTFTEKYKDKLQRLRKEAEITMEIVKYLEDNFISVDVVEFDYNSDERHLSNKVLHEWKGWFEGLGYAVTVKPEQQIAVKAADYICKG
jgi:predicted RNase H-related nuclease YkuK (DUF458 family)